MRDGTGTSFAPDPYLCAGPDTETLASVLTKQPKQRHSDLLPTYALTVGKGDKHPFLLWSLPWLPGCRDNGLATAPC